MLPQPTSAVHATAAHETAGTGRGSATARGSPSGIAPAQGAGTKKAPGLAGLFTELLAQAQKSLGLKGAEGALGPRPKAGGENAHAADKAVSLKNASASKKASAAGMAAHAPSHEGSASKLQAKTPHDAATLVSQGRGIHEKAAKDQAAGTSDAEKATAAANDDKRRSKAKNAASGGETAAIVASATAVKAPLLTAAGAKPAPGRSAEEESSSAKKIESHSSEPKVSLLDLRRSIAGRSEASKTEAKAEELPKDAVASAKASHGDGGRELYRELTLAPSGPGEGGTATAGKADGVSPGSQDFRSMLADRLREAWNGEIVQNAHIVLRDGDSGTIRLRLRPESLGNVKIELNLSENNISGKITVESDEAKSAFERNMSQLSDAFRQGGFDSARLEVAVGGGSGGFGAQARGDGSGGPFFSDRLRSAVASPADPATAASAYNRRGSAVDILA